MCLGMQFAAEDLGPRRRFCMRWGVLLVIVLEDEVGGDARWSKLADMFPEPRERLTDAAHAAREDALQAAYLRIYLYVGHQRDDGYLGYREALSRCRGKKWVLEALTTSVRGKTPFLHRPGDTCRVRNCIDDSPPWVEGFEYRICGFWKKNASRKEKDRHDAQTKELKDPALRDFVYRRDGGCCRFCRSGPMKRKGMGMATDKRRILNVDHIDPDALAGPDYKGVALTCKRCNTHKARRTPEAADMHLLPEPSAELIAYWQDRGERQFDLLTEPGVHPADAIPQEWLDNHANNPPDNPSDNAQTTRSAVVDQVVPDVVQGSVHSAADVPAGDLVSAGGTQDNTPDSDREVSRSGRVGQPPPAPVLGALGQPVRHPSAPDIWHRGSRFPSTGPPGGDPP